MGRSSRRVLLLAGLGAVLGTRTLAQRREPQVHVIAIGVSRYDYGLTSLDYAGSDALKIAAAFKGLDRANRYQVASLATTRVRRQSVLDALDDLAESTEPGDTLVFYFAGHGSRRNGMDYLLLSDSKPDAYITTALSVEMLGEKLAKCKATQRLLILDACRDSARADGLAGFKDGKLESGFRDRLGEVARKAPAGQTVRSAVLYACKPGQRAKESDKERAGIFTSCLENALRASKADTSLTVQALYDRILRAMPRELNGIQAPDLVGSGELVLGNKSTVSLATVAPPVSVVVPRSRLTSAVGLARSRGCPQLAKYLEQMQAIPGGSFNMGSEDGNSVERPVHRVTLTDYWLGRTLVPQELWMEYCLDTRNRKVRLELPARPPWGWQKNHPIVNVSWEDILGKDGTGRGSRMDGAPCFCAWASARSGLELVLPSEAQWEYAARGGGKELRLPWGNEWDGSKVWSGVKPDAANRTAPVDRSFRVYTVKLDNGSELVDMSGNVWQWCTDGFGAYDAGDVTNPKGTSSSERKVLRGGSWGSYIPGYFCCTFRYGYRSTARNNFSGFRLCS